MPSTQEGLPGPLAHGFVMAEALPAGLQIARGDTKAPIALVYGTSKEARAVAKALVHGPDMLYALTRVHAFLTGNTTEEGLRLRRLIADVYTKSTGHRLIAPPPPSNN